MKTSLLRAVPFALVLALPGAAVADDDACYLHREMPLERQLRRLSIDLRGTVPDVSEYEALDGKTELPDDLIDAYLDSDELRIQLRRYHEDLLWTNPSTALGDVGFSLSSQNFPGTGTVYFVPSQGKRKLYRGGDGTHNCQDKPQSDLGYDASGLPLTEPAGTDGTGPYVAEGWVEVHPYWESDPNKKIKVCAFDAQLTETYPSVDPGGNPVDLSCDHNLAGGRKECGCGPEMRFCMLTSAVESTVLSSMREQLLRLVDDHTKGDRPYSDLLLTKRTWVNGPLVHYFKYLGQRQTFSRTQNLHTESDGKLPDVAFTETTKWVEVTREAPHSGILTLPAYLLRFQTNRGRANRYRIAFEGQYFPPPEAKDANCAPEGDDLTIRCVCRGCHVKLEPMAAFFGQLTEAGTTSLRDFEQVYPTAKSCQLGILPASKAWCDRFYVARPDATDPDIQPYALKALRYADAEHPEIQPNFDAGPAKLAQADIDSGLFHEVAVRHMFEFLMKRSVNLDPTSPDYEGDTLAALTDELRAHDNLKLLIKALVKLPQYRRMP